MQRATSGSSCHGARRGRACALRPARHRWRNGGSPRRQSGAGAQRRPRIARPALPDRATPRPAAQHPSRHRQRRPATGTDREALTACSTPVEDLSRPGVAGASMSCSISSPYRSTSAAIAAKNGCAETSTSSAPPKVPPAFETYHCTSSSSPDAGSSSCSKRKRSSSTSALTSRTAASQLRRRGRWSSPPSSATSASSRARSSRRSRSTGASGCLSHELSARPLAATRRSARPWLSQPSPS